ncbi:MAG: hypothetical protein BGO76_08615 [Caedibacter sp. 38-128]|nr:RluA family pseudouridine synthase [Holosporales bacterium]OJX08116.1 MAG: hypothetical protein BGO76_08615 [Caedibacter sp. 38-128]
MTEVRKYIIESQDAGLRLDRVLAQKCSDLSRTRIKNLIEQHKILVEGKMCLPSSKVKENDEIIITIEPLVEALPKPQSIPLDVIYEDQDIIVINKPAGMVVHPAPGNYDQTLVNALLAHCEGSLSGISGVKRPGIVHRLDKGTSGLLVAAKHDKAHQGLVSQFANRDLKRQYFAIVWGRINPLEGLIEGNIGRSPRNRQKMALLREGGKEARTFYNTIEIFGRFASLVECQLETGRTHQIRVHLASEGHGIIGDPLYGRSPKGYAGIVQKMKELTEQNTRPLLHAYCLTFIHPMTQQEMQLKCELPADFKEAMTFLKQNVEF